MATDAAEVLTDSPVPDETAGTSTAPLLSISVRRGANRDVISAVGEIDLSTLPLLYRGLGELIIQGRNELDIDLSAVTFMDAGTLGFLIAAQRQVTSARGSLTLRLNPIGERLMRLTELTKAFDIQGARP